MKTLSIGLLTLLMLLLMLFLIYIGVSRAIQTYQINRCLIALANADRPSREIDRMCRTSQV